MSGIDDRRRPRTPASSIARRAVTVAFSVGLLASACGSDSESGTDAASDISAEDVEVDLASVCPERIVIQSSWFPEPEHGGIYQLIGDDGSADADTGSYSGPMEADPRVTLEVRAGGPYLGNQSTVATLYTDTDIMLGMVDGDEQISAYEDQPSISVIAPLERDPQILLWDADEYDFETLADIGESDATVLYFEGSRYVDFLVGEGLLTEDQLDPSFDGSPSRLLSEDGVVQQGYATQEPYVLENETEQFSGSIDYLLVDESGFARYQSNLAARPEVVDEEADCLAELIPLLQQGSVDFIDSPDRVNEMILEILEVLDGFFQLTEESVAYTAETMVDLEIVGDGPDGTHGNHDEERMAETIDQLLPIYEDQGVSVPSDLTPEDLMTNEFIDPSISFGE